MKVVSEETKRKISEALKRHYATAGKKVNEAKDFVKDISPLGAKETIKREAKNLSGRASYEAKKAVSTAKEKINSATKNLKVDAKTALSNTAGKAKYHARKAAASVRETAGSAAISSQLGVPYGYAKGLYTKGSDMEEQMRAATANAKRKKTK